MSVCHVTVTAPENGRALKHSEVQSPEICAWIKIHAELRRVLYALSTPEYMEAWLHLPGVERFECHAEKGSFDRFRLDIFAASKKLPSVYGSCRLSKPNRVKYYWDQALPGGRSPGLDQIEISGGPDYCAIKLTHQESANQSERLWRSAMWQHSLTKLRMLMERVSAVTTSQRRYEYV